MRSVFLDLVGIVGEWVVALVLINFRVDQLVLDFFIDLVNLLFKNLKLVLLVFFKDRGIARGQFSK